MLASCKEIKFSNASKAHLAFLQSAKQTICLVHVISFSRSRCLYKAVPSEEPKVYFYFCDLKLLSDGVINIRLDGISVVI